MKCALSAEDVIDLLEEVQNDSLNADGCYYDCHYNFDQRDKWLDYLSGKTNIEP